MLRTASDRRFFGRLAAVALINYVSYSWWTLLNKHMFTSTSESQEGHPLHPVPLLCTALQMIIAALCAAVIVLGFGIQRSAHIKFASSRSSATAWALKILPLGLSRAVDIGCGNVALSLVSVALQQIVKSTLPIFVTILSIVVLKKSAPVSVVVSLAPIVLGTMLASSTEVRVQHSWLGLSLAVVSCFGRASKAVLNSALLSASRERLQPLEVVMLEAPMTGLVLLLPGMYFEATHLVHGSSTFTASVDHFVQALRVNVLGGVLMFITQASYVTLIAMTSAVTCQVLMSVKMLLLIFVSVWWLHTPFYWWNVVGVLIAAAGCTGYAAACRRSHMSESIGKKQDQGSVV